MKLEIVSEVKEKSLKAVKWTYLHTLMPRIVTPLTTVILARLLAPADFGLVAVATTTLSLLQIFQDMGLSKALIQSEWNEEDVFNVVFWSNLALSLFLYAILFLSASLIAEFFNNSGATPIIRVLGLKLIFDALGAVQRNVLIRRIQFKQLFYVSVLPTLVPLCVTIPLAYLGYGVWSLVIGNLTSVVLSTFLLWISSVWYPTFRFKCYVSRRVLIFGLWVTLEALVGWFYVQGDNAIVGRYCSTREFGIYVVSYNTVVMVISSLLAPVSSIAYTAFSKIHTDRELLTSKLLDVMRLCALISLPVGVGLFLIAYPATSVVFGSKWIGIESVFGILALVQALAWIVTANPDAYRAIGRPDIVSKFQLAKLLYTIPAYLIAAHFSLMTFVYAKLGVVFIGICLWFLLMLRTFPATARDLFEHLRTPVLATAGMALGMLAIEQILTHFLMLTELFKLVFLLLTGVIVYFGFFYLLEARLFKRVLNIVLYSMRFQHRPTV